MGLIERACEGCGVLFLVERRKLTRGKGRFCGVSCGNRYVVSVRLAKVGQAGALSGNWKGGISQFPARYTLRFQAKYPEKVAAQRAVHAALRAGRMVRPDACSACRSACKPHGHHDDYSQPLVVRWLCRSCHIAFHVEHSSRPKFYADWKAS